MPFVSLVGLRGSLGLLSGLLFLVLSVFSSWLGYVFGRGLLFPPGVLADLSTIFMSVSGRFSIDLF